MLHAAQGGERPERIHVILGTGEQQSFRLAEFSAYFAACASASSQSFAVEPDTYPEPVAHCCVCRWRRALRRSSAIADDHLSLVASITSVQRKKLVADGITTLDELGQLDPEREVPGIRAEQLEKLREQAALQLLARETDENQLELLEPEAERGFARLPEPSAGDVFFDLEGDPFFEGGLEYLWGFVTDDAEGERASSSALWGRDRAEEQAAFEALHGLRRRAAQALARPPRLPLRRTTRSPC